MANLNGGIIGTDNTPTANKITTFNSSGTLTTSSGTTEAEYLVIAGGAGSQPSAGGGGGAGGYLVGTVPLSASTDYSITVGAGGPANNTSATGAPYPPAYGYGSNSVFNGITSTGGGSGGTFQTASPSTAAAGDVTMVVEYIVS